MIREIDQWNAMKIVKMIAIADMKRDLSFLSIMFLIKDEINIILQKMSDKDETLLLGRNLSSDQSMPKQSKLAYEEVIKKNFQTINSFLKKFNIVFNRHQLIQTDINTILARIGKLQADIENVHNQHRKSNLLLHSRVDELMSKINGAESKFNKALQNHNKILTQNEQNRQSLVSTLMKTKTQFQVKENQEIKKQRHIKKSQGTKHKELSFKIKQFESENSIEKKQIQEKISIKKTSFEDQEKQSGSNHKVKRSHSSIKNITNKLRKKRINIPNFSRRKSLMTFEKEKSKKSSKKSKRKNLEIQKGKQAKPQSSLDDFQTDSNQQLSNQNCKKSQGYVHKYIQNDFTKEMESHCSELYQNISNKAQRSMQENFQKMFKENIDKINAKISQFFTKTDLEKYLVSFQRKIQRCQDFYIEHCADKDQTKKALTYLEKKINRNIDGYGLRIHDEGLSEEISRCLACNRILPKQVQIREMRQNKEKLQLTQSELKQKKPISFKFNENIIPKPISINQWKKKSASVLKESNSLHKKSKFLEFRI